MCILSAYQCYYYTIIQVNKRKVNITHKKRSFQLILKKIGYTFSRMKKRASTRFFILVFVRRDGQSTCLHCFPSTKTLQVAALTSGIVGKSGITAGRTIPSADTVWMLKTHTKARDIVNLRLIMTKNNIFACQKCVSSTNMAFLHI